MELGESDSSLEGNGWLRMFRVIAKHDMFDLQAVLLMCWINCVEHETSSLRQSDSAASMQANVVAE
jgi:hypothetical protein